MIDTVAGGWVKNQAGRVEQIDDYDIYGHNDDDGDYDGDNHDLTRWSMAIGQGCWPEMGMPDAEVLGCNTVQWSAVIVYSPS